jgi:hypothetical protein
MADELAPAATVTLAALAQWAIPATRMTMAIIPREDRFIYHIQRGSARRICHEVAPCTS